MTWDGWRQQHGTENMASLQFWKDKCFYCFRLLLNKSRGKEGFCRRGRSFYVDLCKKLRSQWRRERPYSIVCNSGFGASALALHLWLSSFFTGDRMVIMVLLLGDVFIILKSDTRYKSQKKKKNCSSFLFSFLSLTLSVTYYLVKLIAIPVWHINSNSN